MLTITDCAVSCGVKIIGGETVYTEAKTFVTEFCKSKISRFPKFTQFIFTHCITPPPGQDRCMGDKIEEFVRENGLGIITRSELGLNPLHPERKEGDPIPFRVYEGGKTLKTISANNKAFGTQPREHKIAVWVWTIPNDDVLNNFLSPKEK